MQNVKVLYFRLSLDSNKLTLQYRKLPFKKESVCCCRMKTITLTKCFLAKNIKCDAVFHSKHVRDRGFRTLVLLGMHPSRPTLGFRALTHRVHEARGLSAEGDHFQIH